jgi:hypothetical protein
VYTSKLSSGGNPSTVETVTLPALFYEEALADGDSFPAESRA